MGEQLYELAATQGIWTLLSIVLIFYILKVQEKRDKNQYEREISYQLVISNLNEKLNIVEDIRNDVSEIKNNIL
jgi:membrane protein implicated in regulation of membrane protease activity